MLEIDSEPRTRNKPLTLGAKLYELVQQRGVTMSEAARLMGMTRQQFWRIVQGDVENPGIWTLQQAVRGLGGTMQEFFEDGDLVPGGLRDDR